MARTFSLAALLAVLTVLAAAQTTSAFDCGNGKGGDSLLEVGSGLKKKEKEKKEEPTIPAAKLKKLVEEHFKDFKYTLPGDDSAFGWNHIDVSKLDLKYRFKFAEKQKNDKLWAIKIDVFNSNVPDAPAEMSKKLTDYHNMMSTGGLSGSSCKDKALLSDFSIVLNEWQYQTFAKTSWYKPTKWGSDRAEVSFKAGITVRAYYDTENQKWIPGKPEDVKTCIEDIKIKSSGGKTFWSKVAGGLLGLVNVFDGLIMDYIGARVIRKELYCALVDKPPAILAGFGLAKTVSMRQQEILKKCSDGGCSKDFDIPATKKLLAAMQKLKHGFHVLGTVGLAEKGKAGEKLVAKLNVDLETKTDSMVTGILESKGFKVSKETGDATAQVLQQAHWIAASTAASAVTPKSLKQTAVSELYDETYTKMAQKLLKQFNANPKLAGMFQSVMDAVYDSTTNVKLALNGKFSMLPPKAAGSTTMVDFSAPLVALEAAIPHDDPMMVPIDLVLNRPVDKWNVGGKNKKVRVSGIIGMNSTEASFKGPLIEFAKDAASKQKDKNTKSLVESSSEVLEHLFKKGARIVLDASKKGPSNSGLLLDKNFFMFHGGVEFDGPAKLDDSIVYLSSMYGQISEMIEKVAEANLERNKKPKSSLLLQLQETRSKQGVRAGPGHAGGKCLNGVRGTCGKPEECSGALEAGNCRGGKDNVCCVKPFSESPVKTQPEVTMEKILAAAAAPPLPPANVQEVAAENASAPKKAEEKTPISAQAADPEVVKSEVDMFQGKVEQYLQEALAWAKTNPVKHIDDMTCAYEKKGSLLEMMSGKETPIDKVLPRFQVHKNGPNAGKLKCKSPEEQIPVPAFLFRTPISGGGFVGAKKIQINEIDAVFHSELSKDGKELRVWGATAKGDKVSFEHMNALVRQCTANKASATLFPAFNFHFDHIKVTYPEKRQYGYEGKAGLLFRLGFALKMTKAEDGSWAVKTDDVHTCVPKEDRNVFWKFHAKELQVDNYPNPFTNKLSTYLLREASFDARAVLHSMSHDMMYCSMKQALAAKSMLPIFLTALKGAKLDKDGSHGFKIKGGLKLKSTKLFSKANSKNLKVFLKTNFQMNSDVFVHAMLHQVVGMDKINTVAAGAKDALTLLRNYAASLESKDKNDATAASIHRVANMLFEEKNSFEVEAQGGFEFAGQVDKDTPDWFNVKSNRLGIKGQAKEGHLPFDSIMLPLEAIKTVVDAPASFDMQKFIYSAFLNVGSNQLHIHGNADDVLDEMETMLKSTKSSKQVVLGGQYFLDYLRANGIDAHMYLGNKKDEKKPGFFMSKAVTKAAVDFSFVGPVDVTTTLNFAAAAEDRLNEITTEKQLKSMKCFV